MCVRKERNFGGIAAVSVVTCVCIGYPQGGPVIVLLGGHCNPPKTSITKATATVQIHCIYWTQPSKINICAVVILTQTCMYNILSQVLLAQD